MNPLPLCDGGPSLSPIVAGAWRMAEWGWTAQQRLRWIEECVALGLTSFDHADIYGGYTVETLFGEGLALQPGLRAQLQLVSKCGIRLVAPARPSHRARCYDTSAAHITLSVDNSLRALGTGYLDLLLLHRPDFLLDADAVARTFEALRTAGKVRHFGVSNFTPAQFDLLDARIPLATNQVELHPLHRDALHDGTLDQAQRLRRRPMIWSPLAGGRLMAGTDEVARRVQDCLRLLAAQRGEPVATIAYAWLLRLPSRPVPIAGTRRIEALREAIRARAVELTPEEWYAVWQAGAGRDIP
jgi:predicted oxidoreductase